MSGFYAGYLPRVLKKAFSTGLLWTIYEKLSKNDGKNWEVKYVFYSFSFL